MIKDDNLQENEAEIKFGKFHKEHLLKVKSGLKLFNTEMFWECHEELEDPWMEYQGDNARLVYWAIIQVATALVHVRDKNLAGAQGMIGKAQDKIKQIELKKVETDIMNKFLSWKRFKKIVLAIPKNAKLADFDEVYSFRFSNPDKWPF